MPPAQTSYSTNIPVANPGVLYSLEDARVESYAVDTNAIAFGMAVVAGTDPQNQVKVPSATGQTFRGISLKSDSYAQLNSGAVGYSADETVPTLRQGQTWVNVSGAVAIDSPAYFNVTTGQFGPLAAPALTGVYALNAGATGNPTCGTITVTAGTALVGVYRGTFTAATAYDLIDPQGNYVASGATGTAFTHGGLSFTITAGDTAAIEGDGFHITVSSAATTTDPVPTGVFRSATSGAGLARIEINLP